MIHKDKKSGREVEVFTTKEEAKADGACYTALEVTRKGEWSAEVGCWFDEKFRLTDYDGVFELQNDCIRALRAAGYTVPRDFETATKWK